MLSSRLIVAIRAITVLIHRTLESWVVAVGKKKDDDVGDMSEISACTGVSSGN